MNGTEFADTNKVGDLCLAYFYINGKDKPMVQIEARTKLAKSGSFTSLNSPDQSTYQPIINSLSINILKKVNKLSNDTFENRLYDSVHYQKKQTWIKKFKQKLNN